MTLLKKMRLIKNHPKSKISGGTVTKRSISKTSQDGKESTSTPKRLKRKTSVPDVFSPDQKIGKIKIELNMNEAFNFVFCNKELKPHKNKALLSSYGHFTRKE